MTEFLRGFTTAEAETDGIRIHYARGGDGPPLLLLHGFPQTHAMWHKIAPQLARRFTVIAPDLRGYGESSKPAGDSAHATYSKRVMALDQAGLMRSLGYEFFDVVSHDRGARVAHRLALDHPAAVKRLVLMDIAPTLAMYEATSQLMATAYFHWFFLIQPAPFPERLLGGNPDFVIDATMLSLSRRNIGAFPPEILSEYKHHFRDPATIHAICEDYRAGASIDLDHDRADLSTKKITCPTLVLWGETGLVGKMFDVVEVWRTRAQSPELITGQALPCGHFLAEEAPQETLAMLDSFL
jgi:haloacetate dehalogenase